MRSTFLAIAAIAMASMFVVPAAHAQVHGAIFTTLPDGSEVNFNIYASKDLVYLDGGPGPGAPQTAAGLPDGNYVFMVTDPSGKTLLSTDPAQCREFTISGGIVIGDGISGGCAHVTGNDVDHNAITVQLLPYNDTPNKGGEYKVWATLVSNYACYPDLSQVDCTVTGSRHGFVHSLTKTDNFKVKATPVIEIDTRFFKNGQVIDGASILWTDTLGNSNTKWSYYNQALDINHEAHVEAPESGVHQITIAPQSLCTNPGNIYDENGSLIGNGSGTINVRVSPNINKGYTYRVDVYCN